MRNPDMENPAPGPRGVSEDDLLGCSVNLEGNETSSLAQDRWMYLLLEIRCAALRLRLMLSEVQAIGLSYKVGLISGDAAIEFLREIDAPFWVKGKASEEEAQ